MSKTHKAILVVLLILLADQVSKIIVKTNMHLGESIPVFGSWFMIRFIENPGMAFGWDIPGQFGKIALSLFRLVAIIGIIWYLRNLIRQNAQTLLVISVAMILAGAIGNLLDSAFYGLIFDKGTVYDPEYGRWFGYGGQAAFGTPGYAAPFKGCVVDMLYFPVIEGTYPSWFPFKAGENFIFFRPIFNLADSSISVGVFIILLFQKRLFHNLK
ncbi:MAG TPA: lipoprotein signal peptidase [Bacteroidales bacterium]|jgi:signal peptidase II|nr:lipoprotein signal peptidase [Bacteroidales bacterium]